MKLGMQEHVHITSGVQEEIKVEFETNAVAFYATFSGLAKDKIGYPIRELDSNAWDHSRGNFEVHLPTPLNPVFRVRDYGPGMSKDEMKNVYARPYASTKRDDNNSVGGWGIGSKSPFAYLIGKNGAGSYNVTSYNGGMMRSYIMSIAKDGMPKMSVLAELPSDEPSGLEVSFAVRREDIATFHDRARQILWSFNPRPTITPAINWPEPVITSQGENWTSYKSNSVPFYGPHVRMGCVMYPVDMREITTSGFLDVSDCVLFEAPIGSLNVTLSREALAYEDATKTTLQSLIAQYENSFISQVREKVDAADSLFNAVKMFETECSPLGQTREERLRKLIRWRGLYLGYHINKEDAKLNMLGNGWSTFEKFEDCHVRQPWAADAKIVIEHNPSYSLSRFSMAGLIGEKVLWVRCKRIHREKVLAQLGNPTDVIELDSFKVPVEKRISKTIRRRKTLMVLSGGRIQRLTQDVDMADGGLMVETAPSTGWGRRNRGSEFYRVMDSVPGIQFGSIEEVLSTCFDFGLLEVGQIILVKAPDMEVADNWTMIGDDIVPALREKINVSEFTGLHQKTTNNMNHHLRKVASMPGDFRSDRTVQDPGTPVYGYHGKRQGVCGAAEARRIRQQAGRGLPDRRYREALRAAVFKVHAAQDDHRRA
jgi:hypothetical protein